MRYVDQPRESVAVRKHDGLLRYQRRSDHPTAAVFLISGFVDDPVGFVGGNEAINACRCCRRALHFVMCLQLCPSRSRMCIG